MGMRGVRVAVFAVLALLAGQEVGESQSRRRSGKKGPSLEKTLAWLKSLDSKI